MLKRLLLVRGAELGLFAFLAALPLAVASPYALGLLTLLAIYGILLIGLDVTVGYLGQVNLAQAAFLGLGGYAAGISVTRFGSGLPLAVVVAEDEAARSALDGIVLLAVAVALGAFGLGGRAALALGKPVEDLIGAAEKIGSGAEPPPRPPRSRGPSPSTPSR